MARRRSAGDARPIALRLTFADEEPHRSFGRDLVGQTWSLDLEPAGARDR